MGEWLGILFQVSKAVPVKVGATAERRFGNINAFRFFKARGLKEDCDFFEGGGFSFHKDKQMNQIQSVNTKNKKSFLIKSLTR